MRGMAYPACRGPWEKDASHGEEPLQAHEWVMDAMPFGEGARGGGCNTPLGWVYEMKFGL